LEDGEAMITELQQPMFYAPNMKPTLDIKLTDAVAVIHCRLMPLWHFEGTTLDSTLFQCAAISGLPLPRLTSAPHLDHLSEIFLDPYGVSDIRKECASMSPEAFWKFWSTPVVLVDQCCCGGNISPECSPDEKTSGQG
jgi:hypothetical protein